MISKVISQDRADLIKLYKAMTPEERLVAFYNHSRLLHKLHRAGKSTRRPSTRKARKNT